MIITSFVITHPGRCHSNNEDNFYINGLWKDNTEIPVMERSCSSRENHQIYAVCDGMGGEAHGEQASLDAVRILADCIGGRDACGDFTRFAELYIKRVNQSLLRMKGVTGKTPGTTLALCAICEESLSVPSLSGSILSACGVGDSRIYLYHNNSLNQLTVDHTMARVMEELGISKTGEGRRKPSGNALLQYLGVPEAEVLIEPCYIIRLPVEDGDMVMLCSDGLTDMVGEDAILGVLGGTKGLEDKGRRLTELALEAGGRDNITILLILIGA